MKTKAKLSYTAVFIFAFSTALLMLASLSDVAARIINSTLCYAVRSLLASISSLVPFSVFEIVALGSPVMAFLAVFYTVKGKGEIRDRFFFVISLALFVCALYILTLGIAYRVQMLPKEYETEPVDSETLAAAGILLEELNTLSQEEQATPTLNELRAEFTKSYAEISHAYGLVAAKLPKAKPLITSRLLNYIGTLSLYSFPTGEVNINLDIPEYMIPFTVAHEYAHALGVAGEGQANLLAFVACYNSAIPAVRYSAVLSALEYLLSDISNTDPQTYALVYKNLPERALSDIASYREYYKKYNNNPAYRVTEGLNGAHLGAWDKAGTKSYSLTSRYVSRYLASNRNSA